MSWLIDHIRQHPIEYLALFLWVLAFLAWLFVRWLNRKHKRIKDSLQLLREYIILVNHNHIDKSEHNIKAYSKVFTFIVGNIDEVRKEVGLKIKKGVVDVTDLAKAKEIRFKEKFGTLDRKLEKLIGERENKII